MTSRPRPEHHTTTTPLRRADSALTSTAGALLAPRLSAATAHFRALFDLVGSGTRFGTLVTHRIVEQVLTNIGTEDRLIER
jgi:hypothetical protein